MGQILGPHPQSQTVKKVQARPVQQKQISEPKPTPQQPSSESKAFTHTGNHQQHLHQPLQQIPLPQTETLGGTSNAVSLSAIQYDILVVFSQQKKTKNQTNRKQKQLLQDMESIR